MFQFSVLLPAQNIGNFEKNKSIFGSNTQKLAFVKNFAEFLFFGQAWMVFLPKNSYC